MLGDHEPFTTPDAFQQLRQLGSCVTGSDCDHLDSPRKSLLIRPESQAVVSAASNSQILTWHGAFHSLSLCPGAPPAQGAIPPSQMFRPQPLRCLPARPATPKSGA